MLITLVKFCIKLNIQVEANELGQIFAHINHYFTVCIKILLLIFTSLLLGSCSWPYIMGGYHHHTAGHLWYGFWSSCISPM